MESISNDYSQNMYLLTKFLAATGAPGLAHLWKISTSRSNSCSDAGAKDDVGARVTIRHITICEREMFFVNDIFPLATRNVLTPADNAVDHGQPYRSITKGTLLWVSRRASISRHAER